MAASLFQVPSPLYQLSPEQSIKQQSTICNHNSCYPTQLWLITVKYGIQKRVTLRYVDISMQFPCRIARLLSFVCSCFNPVARIIVIQVCFCKTTEKWILHLSLCCNYTFVWVRFSFSLFSRCCAYALPRFRTHKTLGYLLGNHQGLAQNNATNASGNVPRFS